MLHIKWKGKAKPSNLCIPPELRGFRCHLSDIFMKSSMKSHVDAGALCKLAAELSW